MSDPMSRPYEPDTAQCCEACVFGRGEHTQWCEARLTAWMEMHLAPQARLAALRPSEDRAAYRRELRACLAERAESLISRANE